jgi:hypothetical protein
MTSVRSCHCRTFVKAVKPALEDGDLRIFWLSPATRQNPNRSLYVFF